MLFYPKTFVIDDYGKIQFNPPHARKVHEYEELKVMSIGCSNLWDMRILQDFILFSQGNTLFHLQYENDGEP